MSCLDSQNVRAEFLRYVINGLFATAVHYGVLETNMRVLQFGSAGAANLVAACFGIVTSFVGARFFVFQTPRTALLPQAIKFGLLYMSIALLHGGAMYVWADVAGFDYRLGFLLATVLQIAFSYVGNRFLVFKL